MRLDDVYMNKISQLKREILKTCNINEWCKIFFVSVIDKDKRFLLNKKTKIIISYDRHSM